MLLILNLHRIIESFEIVAGQFSEQISRVNFTEDGITFVAESVGVIGRCTY